MAFELFSAQCGLTAKGALLTALGLKFNSVFFKELVKKQIVYSPRFIYLSTCPHIANLSLDNYNLPLLNR
jgi:hypothetical protein